MNRMEFLRSCASGFCACALFRAPLSADTPATEPPKPEDWRLPFVKRRYGHLLHDLSERVGDRTLNEILQAQGRYCASTTDLLRKHKGDLDGFIRTVSREWKWEVAYDRDRGVVTINGPEAKDCFCPLIDGRYAPKSACECSLGWNRYAFETVSGRKAQVELKESVLRGGRRCSFEVRLGERLAG